LSAKKEGKRKMLSEMKKFQEKLAELRNGLNIFILFTVLTMIALFLFVVGIIVKDTLGIILCLLSSAIWFLIAILSWRGYFHTKSKLEKEAKRKHDKEWERFKKLIENWITGENEEDCQ
jgi:hypothetical protein